MKPLDGLDSSWQLVDPQLAVDFVGTQRYRGDALADGLPPDHVASVWVQEHLGSEQPGQRMDLIDLRAQLRALFTAIVEATAVPAGALDTINRLAGRAPVTLAGQLQDDGIVVKRLSTAAQSTLLRADLARSALTLLVEPARTRLQLCGAPRCALFFLTDDRRQLWCNSRCGNRARVARHYVRHRS